jgi:Ca-activated chloride channel family protein
MVATITASIVLALSLAAEWLHWRRTRRLAHLAFGPRGKANLLGRVSPLLKIAAQTALGWGLATLLVISPQTVATGDAASSQPRHVVILLDVSPSMRLDDAGRDRQQSRMRRGKELIESLFDRVPIQQYRLSVIAFYDKAIPVVIDTKDIEVVKNCFNDLPLNFAFKGKQTNLFAGLEAAAEITRPWNPNSTVLIIVTDGDTVPASGMPKLPASISRTLVVGVGDPISGKFIDGRQSRQDTSTLRQVATRIGGEFHNGNEQHISTAAIQRLTAETGKKTFRELTARDFALLAVLAGSALLALLPVALHYFGSSFGRAAFSLPARKM